MMNFRFYLNLSIDEKINCKSWFVAIHDHGFMTAMIENATAAKRDDFANYTRHYLVSNRHFQAPK